MALVTPFMQNLLGYPILTAGFLLGSRGLGTLFTMMVAPWLMARIEARTLIAAGFGLTAATLYSMSGFTDNTGAQTIIVVSIVQGVGLGLVFVPLTAVAFLTLPNHLRTAGTSITTLVRNIGSSIGISMVIANLTSKTTYMHARLAESVTPFNDALQMPDVASTLNLATDTGRAMLDGIVTQQANIIAYQNDYWLLMWLTLAVLPLTLIVGSSKALRQPSAKIEAHALD